MINCKHRGCIFSSIFIILIMGVLFLALVWRILHGVELTDEAFYIELANRMSLGNIPLYDMWEQAQTASLFLYPAVWLLRTLTGEVEGIVLLARLVYLFYALISSILFYFLTRKTVIGKRVACIASLCFIFYAPFSIYCVSYNTMINCFLFLMFGIVLNIEMTQSREWWKYCSLGIVLALGALSYPTFVVFAVLQIILYGVIICFCKGIKAGIKSLLWMITGGAVIAGTAIFIMVFLIGYKNIILGVNGILSDTVYNLKSNILFRIKFTLIETFRFYFVNMKMILIICVLGIIRLLKEKAPYLYLVLIAIPIYAFYQSYKAFPVMETLITVTSIGSIIVILPFMYFMTNQFKKEIFVISLSSIIISGIGFIVIAASSAGYGIQISHLFFTQYLAFYLCIYFLFREQSSIVEHAFKPFFSTRYIFFVPVIIMLTSFVLTSYREVKVWHMDSQIDYGVYKYLYTTKDRKEYVEYLENSMADVKRLYNSKSVMVLHQAPFLYLFLDIKPIVPTTWGIYDYPYPTNEPVFYKYFQDLNTKPDTVIIVDDLKGKTASKWEIQTPWLTGDFLNEYNFVDKITENDFPQLLIYTRKRGK